MAEITITVPDGEDCRHCKIFQFLKDSAEINEIPFCPAFQIYLRENNDKVIPCKECLKGKKKDE